MFDKYPGDKTWLLARLPSDVEQLSLTSQRAVYLRRELDRPPVGNSKKEQSFRKVMKSDLAGCERMLQRAVDAAGHKIKPPPLTDRERAVLDLIRQQPEGSGIMGKGIVKALRNTANRIEQGTLTKDIIPKLKEHYQVASRKGAGYYIDTYL